MIATHILDHFKNQDPILYKAALEVKDHIMVQKSHHLFSNLCESIICQQLSDKVGAVICNRFLSLFPSQEATPEKVLTYSIEDLRALGISRAKASYILDLATKVAHKEIHLEDMSRMSDHEVIDELTKVKGIGTWTAEMFLMFTLGREDIFSCGDLGLKRAIQKLYNIEAEPSKEELLHISIKWSPYRTYASRILWNILK